MSKIVIYKDGVKIGTATDVIFTASQQEINSIGVDSFYIPYTSSVHGKMQNLTLDTPFNIYNILDFTIDDDEYLTKIVNAYISNISGMYLSNDKYFVNFIEWQAQHSIVKLNTPEEKLRLLLL